MTVPRDAAAEAAWDRKKCPTLTTPAKVLARQSVYDAAKLVRDVREVDPREVAGRLNRWGHDNPERLLAVVIALAAAVEPQRPMRALHAWTQHIGGVAALHPHYDHRMDDAA